MEGGNTERNTGGSVGAASVGTPPSNRVVASCVGGVLAGGGEAVVSYVARPREGSDDREAAEVAGRGFAGDVDPVAADEVAVATPGRAACAGEARGVWSSFGSACVARRSPTPRVCRARKMRAPPSANSHGQWAWIEDEGIRGWGTDLARPCPSLLALSASNKRTQTDPAHCD